MLPRRRLLAARVGRVVGHPGANRCRAVRLEAGAKKPLHQYDSLWKRKTNVSEQTLVHDSILHCCANWSAAWLVETIEREYQNDYNSLNVVAAMLTLCVVWPE